MNFRNSLMAIALAVAAFSAPVFAQTAPPAADVTLSLTANMPNLKDAKALNTFSGKIIDAQLRETSILKCTAGRSKWAVFHENKTCASQPGSGTELFIAKTNTWVPRVLLGGFYEVQEDGTTEGSTLVYDYQAVGAVAPSKGAFGGSLLLKPELASTGAKGLVDDVLGGLTKQAGSAVINKETDTITFANFCLPSAGYPSDKGTCFNGDAVYSYQNYAWFFRVNAKFKDQDIRLEGNMPFTTPAIPENVDPNKPAVTEYNVSLQIPGQVAASTTTDDDAALFAEFDPDAGLSALPNGISGKLTMKNSAYTEVAIGQETILAATAVQLDGTLHGTGIPLEVVRAFGKLIVEILPETFVGP